MKDDVIIDNNLILIEFILKKILNVEIYIELLKMI